MKRVSFYSLLLMSLLLGGCLFLSACQETVQQSDSKITLEFWTMQLADFKETLEPMFADYEKTHPTVKIKWVDVPGNEIEKRTLTAAMSPHVPDVVNLNPDFSAILASRKALLNLDDFLTKEQQQDYLPVAWQAATLFQPSGLESNVEQPHTITKQNTFGLPWYITSSVTFYNKALLQKSGVQKPPASYQEVLSFAKTVRAKTGDFGLMPIVTQNGNFLKELTKAGVPLYDASGQPVFADNPKALNLLNTFLALYQQNLIPAEAMTEGHRAAVDRYQSGTLAMLLSGPNFLNIVKENALSVYQQTGVLPQFGSGTYKDFSLMLLVVPLKSQHPKEAVEFARFITNHQNQLALAHKAPVLPSVVSALNEAEFKKEASADLMERARSISARQLLEAKTAYQIRPRQNEINEAVNYYVQLVLLGKVSPQEGLQQAQNRIQAILQ